MTDCMDTERRAVRDTGGRKERKVPTYMTALGHGMIITASRGDTAARELTPEYHRWVDALVAIRNDDAPQGATLDV
jgi:hypothetical protein